MEEEIINKVASSNIETIDLADFYPPEKDVIELDFKKYLFMEIILKEKDFREQLKISDFSEFKNKYVCIFCSVDAIIPQWSYMLLATYLHPFTSFVFFGNKEKGKEHFFSLLFLDYIRKTDYSDKRVVLKGCGEILISENAYLLATTYLLPQVKSIMFGEPCSTVPIYKKK